MPDHLLFLVTPHLLVSGPYICLDFFRWLLLLMHADSSSFLQSLCAGGFSGLGPHLFLFFSPFGSSIFKASEISSNLTDWNTIYMLVVWFHILSAVVEFQTTLTTLLLSVSTQQTTNWAPESHNPASLPSPSPAIPVVFLLPVNGIAHLLIQESPILSCYTVTLVYRCCCAIKAELSGCNIRHIYYLKKWLQKKFTNCCCSRSGQKSKWSSLLFLCLIILICSISNSLQNTVHSEYNQLLITVTATTSVKANIICYLGYCKKLLTEEVLRSLETSIYKLMRAWIKDNNTFRIWSKST